MKESELIAKYNRPLPRYTSFPTVPFWAGINHDSWVASVFDANPGESPIPVSLYVHVPYCASLCSFCACTRVISRNKSLAEPFVDHLLKELDLKLESFGKLSRRFVIHDIHLGGGTPTWLPPDELDRMLSGIRSAMTAVHSSEDSEISASGGPQLSVEIDPRTCAADHVEVLAKHGLSRVSLGIQDFHEPTLKAIKRFQTQEEVHTVIDLVRAKGVDLINFDLVYGLPYQTKQSMKDSMQTLKIFGPTRVALYSYAHLPQLKKHQIGVAKHGLPEAHLKQELYQIAKASLIEAGYVDIGMDHFALPDDELFKAHESGKLHRNFMGYTDHKPQLLLGLGPSSMSDSGLAYAQNPKEVGPWFESITAGNVDPVNGHRLSPKDLESRERILDLICRGRARVSPDEWECISMSELAQDGLISWDEASETMHLLPEGEPFVRNICALFDDYLVNKPAPQLDERPRFSQSI